MNKSFSMEGSQRDFLKNYLKSLTPFVLIAGTILFQLMSSGFPRKLEVLTGIVALFITAAVFAGFSAWTRYSRLRYIVSDHSIQVFDRNKNRVDTYYLHELVDIKLPAGTDTAKKSRQSIRLSFSSGGKLVFTSLLPYYGDLKEYLTEILAGFTPPPDSSYPTERRTKIK